MTRTRGFRKHVRTRLSAAALALGLAAGFGIIGAPPVAAQTPLPDLAVWVEWSTYRVLISGSLSFQVLVTNDGPPPLGPVPAGAVVRVSITYGTITGISTANSGFTCPDANRGPREAVCRRDTPMAPGTAVTFLVGVQAPTQPGTITATATASLPTSLPDKDPRNNSSTRVAQVYPALVPDLTVSIAGLPDPVVGLSDVAYTLDVTNAGSGDAAGVTVRHTLPAGATFVRAGSGCTHASGVISCALGTVPAGRLTHTNIVSRAPLGPGSLVYTAAIDPVAGEQSTSNNSASVARANLGAPDLKPIVTSVTWYIRDFPGASFVGTSTAGVLLQVNVMNLGPGPAGPTTLRVELPPELAKFVNASDPVNRELLGRRIPWAPEDSRDVHGPRPSCSLSPSVVMCSIPQLAGGTSTGTTDLFAVLLRKINVTLESVFVPFTIRADADRVLREHDESNNVVVRTVPVVQGLPKTDELSFSCRSNNDCSSGFICRDGKCVRR